MRRIVVFQYPSLLSSVCRCWLPFPVFSSSISASIKPQILRQPYIATMATRRSARLSSAAEKLTVPDAVAMPPPPSHSRKRKVASQDDSLAAPSTPQKRRTQRHATPPPATPTPSAVGLLAQPVSSQTPKRSRVADLAKSNAPLLSPETSRVIAPKLVETVSPSKKGTLTTTENLLDEACAHLVKIDARMKPLVDAHRCHMFSPEGLAEKIDPFESLCSGIISQQVSVAAAKAIKARFVALFDEADAASAPTHKRFPHPSQVAATSLERLRTAGLSQRKAEYIQGLAEKFASGELTAQLLADAPYEEVVEKLVAVRGLGKWSVEMFACFGLKRMDVFSLGDLGVQRGMAVFVGRDVAKLKAKGGKWKYMSEQYVHSSSSAELRLTGSSVVIIADYGAQRHD